MSSKASQRNGACTTKVGLTGYAGREIFAVPGSPYVLKGDQVVAWNPSITR